MTFVSAFAAIEHGPIAPAVVRAAFEEILEGAWTSVQIGAFATALRMRGETAEAIVAAAEALRSVMAGVDHDFPEVLDTCGTGGDGAHTLNVSTGAAIVVAACGAIVAKHGNSSVSSRSGSADVVNALGIPTHLDPAHQGAVHREAGIAFLMAPAHHPAPRRGRPTSSSVCTTTRFDRSSLRRSESSAFVVPGSFGARTGSTRSAPPRRRA